MSVTSFLQFRQQLAQRLNDPSKIFWTDPELKLYVYDALRFWNALTGDARQWYSLTVPGTTQVWYDLYTIASSPRVATQTDQDIYSRMQYMLLEQQAPAAQCLTGQYFAYSLITAVQGLRDAFLFSTAAASTIESLAVTPNSPTVALPPSVIAVRRAYWLPTSNDGTGYPMFMGDEWEISSYQPLGTTTPATPVVYSTGTVPPYIATLAPPPSQTGRVEFITYESQGMLNPSVAPTVMVMPDDFMPAIVWGSLADILSTTTEGHDAARAQYCEQRYAQFVELYSLYPSVLAARVGNVPLYVDAVETLDTYSPDWRLQQANPQVMGLSGGNLIAFPSATPMNVPILVVGNAPLPANDNAAMPLGNEVLDVVLDYAQHIAMFKCGGAEFLETLPLLSGIVKLAAERNAQVRALSTFRDILMTRAQREDQLAAKEKIGGDSDASQ